MTSHPRQAGDAGNEPGTHESHLFTIQTSGSTFGTTTASTYTGGLHLSITSTFIILVATSSILILGTLAYFYLRKRRYIPCHRCLQILPTRKRSSSTSSQGPLTQDDATFNAVTSEPRPERELFSIADQDGGEDGRRSSHGRRSTDDDYFYDEIFERSAFVDASTNRAIKTLTIEHDEEDELDIPDLVFKKEY